MCVRGGAAGCRTPSRRRGWVAPRPSAGGTCNTRWALCARTDETDVHERLVAGHVDTKQTARTTSILVGLSRRTIGGSHPRDMICRRPLRRAPEARPLVEDVPVPRMRLRVMRTAAHKRDNETDRERRYVHDIVDVKVVKSNGEIEPEDRDDNCP
jgi:hypothetical protein